MNSQNNGNRLFVTPNQSNNPYRRQNNNPYGGRQSHPHNGEGNCGGIEGHGKNDTVRRPPEPQRSYANGRAVSPDGKQVAPNGKENIAAGKASRGEKNNPALKKENQGAEEEATAAFGVRAGITVEDARRGFTMSLILGEPLCRRYGMQVGGYKKPRG